MVSCINIDSTRTGTITKMFLYDIETFALTPVEFGGKGVVPVSQYWDCLDYRVLVCQVEGIFESKQDQISYREVFTMFATFDSGLVIQDRQILVDGDFLIGVSMPFHFYAKKSVNINGVGEDTLVEQRIVKDFDGMDVSDPATVKAALDFSFQLCLGNMDEAFKSIHAIKSRAIWESLARICVKTKRLDVARLCLSNVGNSHTLRALREAKKEPETDVQVAILAAHLGMMPEAEKLLLGCGRYDILNRIYQAGCEWNKSLELTETKNRINLRTTYHKFGKYLQEIGDTVGALAALEKSASSSFEIPKMLLNQSDNQLEIYVKNSSDKVHLN